MRGVVDQDVGAAQFVDGLSNERAAMAGILDVACHENGFAAFGFDELLHLFGCPTPTVWIHSQPAKSGLVTHAYQ